MGLEAFDGIGLEAFVDSGLEARGEGKCACRIYIAAQQWLIPPDLTVWNLRPYQGPGKADPPCGYWRIMEMTYCFPLAYPWYGAGRIGSDGAFLGMPDQFETGFVYNGHMELHVGCALPDDPDTIEWPLRLDPFDPFDYCQRFTPARDFP